MEEFLKSFGDVEMGEETKDVTHSASGNSPNLPLEEYKETLAYLRHFDQLGWTILGLSISASLGLWAYTFKDIPFFSGQSLGLAGLGVVVLGLGRLMARRFTDYTTSCWSRAEQLETILGFQLLTATRDRMPKRVVPRVNLLLNLIAIGSVVGWLVYLGAFIWRFAK
jgi:hypothetical protein